MNLDKKFGLSDVFGLVVGVLIGRGLTTPFTNSALFQAIFFAIVIGVGILAALLRGPSTLFKMAVYTFLVVAWLMGLFATFILGVGLDILLELPNVGGATIFATLLVFYLFVAWFKHWIRGMANRQLGLKP